MDAAASLAIGAVTIDPTDPTIVSDSTGEGNFVQDSFFGVGLYRIENALSAAPVVKGPFETRINGDRSHDFIGTSITKIIVDPSSHNNILVGNSYGVGGVGSNGVCCANPNTSGLLGLYLSNNAQAGNPNFVSVTGLPGSGAIGGITDIVMEPGTSNTVVVGVRDEQQQFSGVYRSTNAVTGGAASTWTKIVHYSGTKYIIDIFPK